MFSARALLRWTWTPRRWAWNPSHAPIPVWKRCLLLFKVVCILFRWFCCKLLIACSIGSVIDMSTTPGDTGDIPVSVQRAPRASVATTKRQSAIQLNCSGLVDKLKTAISTREDNSICKYLTPIITLLEGHGAGTANAAAKREYQKAFGKADLGAILFLCMHELLTSSEVRYILYLYIQVFNLFDR